MSELKAVPQQPEPQYKIGKKAADDLFTAIVELPWKVANPLIKHLQDNLVLIEEAKSAQSTNPE